MVVLGTRQHQRSSTMLAKIHVLTILAGLLGSSLAQPAIELSLYSTYATGIFDKGAQEINAYDPLTRKVFTTNSNNKTVDVLDITKPSNLTRLTSIDLLPYGIDPNSVAVPLGGLFFAVCGSNVANASEPGKVLFFTTNNYTFLGSETVGAVPDMVTFTKDGKTLLVANEGELANTEVATSTNPEGSVSIITNITLNPFSVSSKFVRFTEFDGQEGTLRALGVRITAGISASFDFEPEYITTYGTKAYVTLQENNAIAVIDIPSAKIDKIIPLGYKNHFLPKNGIDASDRDSAINIVPYRNLLGMYMPDSIASYLPAGASAPLLVIANEGDARYESVRATSLTLGTTAFPDLTIKNNDKLGRLAVSNLDGKNPVTNAYDTLFSFGARSFSIVDAATGAIVYDSGDAFENITAAIYGRDFFNSNHNGINTNDTRSDDKGPEPEAIAVGTIEGYTYAFIGFERQGGVMVYDITDPKKVEYVTYFNNRNFTAPIESPEAGDLGPEGFTFVPIADSPTGEPLLIVGAEISGTTSVYKIKVNRKVTGAPVNKPTAAPVKPPTYAPTKAPVKPPCRGFFKWLFGRCN